MKLELDALERRYGGIRALDRISFTAEAGEIVAVLGGNGAGKSTLLRAIGGMIELDGGEIRVDGCRLSPDDLALRKRIAFLSDTPALLPNASVVRHIGIVLRLYGRDDPGAEDRVLELLKEFEILPNIESPGEAQSRGELYKSALVAILAADPELLLLDEPFSSGMDPQGITALKKRLRSAAARGHTILYSTQILELAEQFSDRVCVLHRGSLRAFDSIELLKEQHGLRYGVLEEVFRTLREKETRP
jgi:ABC-type multidrug transport system ATPase subunit